MTLKEKMEKYCGCLAGTVSFAILCPILCALAILPIAMISVGSVYLNSCQAERNIPIYLIVGGCFFLVSGCCHPTGKDEEGSTTHNPLGYVLGVFNVAWLLSGSVWVFSSYPPDYYDYNSVRYCHKGLYLFAFSIIIIQFVLFGLAIICCIGLLVYCLYYKKK